MIDFITIGSPVLVRCFGKLGLALSIAGVLRAGQQLDQGSCLPITHFARFGFPLSTFQASRFGLSSSALDLLTLGSSLPVRGIVCPGSSAFVLDFLHLGPLPTSHSPARLELFLLALDCPFAGPLLPTRRNCCLDFLLLVLGAGRSGLLPLACDCLIAGPSPLPKGLSRPDFVMLVFHFGHSDSLPSLQASASLDVPLSALGAA